MNDCERKVLPEEEEDPLVQEAQAMVEDLEAGEEAPSSPRSPAQRVLAREKAKWQRIQSRKTLKRSPTRTTRKTLDDQFTKMLTQLAEDDNKASTLPGGQEAQRGLTRKRFKSRARGRRLTDPEDPMDEVASAISKNHRLRKTLAKKATLLKNTRRVLRSEGPVGSEGEEEEMEQGGASAVPRRKPFKGGRSVGGSDPASPTDRISAVSFVDVFPESTDATSQL